MPSSAQDGIWVFDSANSSARVVSSHDETSARNVNFLHTYRLRIPDDGVTQLWRVEASIGFDFLTSGSVGLRLAKPDVLRHKAFGCVANGNCTIATGGVLYNHKVLNVVLPPGEYDLDVFDRAGEREESVPSCSPIHLRVVMEPSARSESYVSCAAQPLTPVLSGHGSVDGRASYSESCIIDLSAPSHTVQIYVDDGSDAVFRAFVTTDRVDIDLALRDDATGETIASSARIGSDGILAVLTAGKTYQLVLEYYGTYNPTFCETYHISMSLESLDGIVADSCSVGTFAGDVDLSVLTGMLSANVQVPGSTTVRRTNHVSQGYETAITASGSFTVNAPATLVANIWHDFALGPLAMTLSAEGEGSAVMITSEERGTYAFLSVALQPGVTYDLTLRTVASQLSTPGANRLPSCLFYLFDAEVIFADGSTQSDPSCLERPQLPTEAAISAAGGSTGYFHVQDVFAFPQNLETAYIKVTPSRRSFLRAYAEAHAVDVDFHLHRGSRDGTLVASALALNTEETLMHVLEAGETYYFEIPFFTFFKKRGFADDGESALAKRAVTPAERCAGFALELAVEPIDHLVRALCPGADDLPTDGAIDGTNLPSMYARRHYFSQTSSSDFLSTVEFTVAEESTLRAEVFMDFLLGHLGMRLYEVSDAGSGLTARRLLTEGRPGFDRQAIDALVLQPGTYELELYEPSGMESPALRGCVHFDLLVGLEPSNVLDSPFNVDPSDVALLSCHGVRIPSRLNDVAHLSARSGNAVHFSGLFLANTVDRSETMYFSLTEQSVFRLFLPFDVVVDVDAVLYQLASDGSRTVIGSALGYDAETLFFSLAPGEYQVHFRYYGRRGNRLPGAISCTTIAMEVALAPISLVSSTSSVTSSCASQQLDLPNAVPFNATFGRTLPSSSGETAFHAQVPLVVSSDYESIVIEGEADFLSSSVAVVVSAAGQVGGAPSHELAEVSLQYSNGRFYHTGLLPEGNYTLSVFPTASVAAERNALGATSAVCAPFSLAVALGDKSAVGPSEIRCAIARPLPTNVSSLQDPVSGALRYSTTTARLMRTSASAWMYFDAPEAVLARFYVNADDGGADIDFFVYRVKDLEGNDDSLELVSYSNDPGDDESTLFTLDPSPLGYALEVFFFQSSVDEDACETFSFEASIESQTQVRDELRCPIDLPNEVDQVPSSEIYVYNDVFISDDSFYFTGERIRDGTNVSSTWFSTTSLFKYRMTLHNTFGFNSTLDVSIGFDFLANNFELVLVHGRTGNPVARSRAMPGSDASSELNFYSTLHYLMAEDETYYLDIVEDLTDKDFGFSGVNYCHRFSLDLTIETRARPYVVYVLPSSSRNMNPMEDLTVTVWFSTDVVVDSAAHPSLTSWVRDSKLLYLHEAETGAHQILPRSVYLDPQDASSLKAVFDADNFASDTEYELELKASAFSAAEPAGSFFDEWQSGRSYYMIDCTCSGRGSCQTVGYRYQCVCDDPRYGGEDCNSCADGYHAAANTCVENTACTDATCSGHGRCHDERGFPQCSCDDGFASAGDALCGICAAGYDGYPFCAPTGTQGRDAGCDAPLLPLDLNSVSYLGYDGQMHARDQYFLDVQAYEHRIDFALTKESVFRVALDKHWVDIDVTLTRRSRDAGSGRFDDELIASSTSWGLEDSIFALLEGDPEEPVEYALYLDLYVRDWARAEASHCETFGMELAVIPTASLPDEPALASTCEAAAQSATPIMPDFGGRLSSADPPVLVLDGTDFVYEPSTLFAASAHRNGPVASPHDRLVVFETVLDVPEPEVAGTLVWIEVEIAYQFPTGDLALRLERGTDGVCVREQGGSSFNPTDEDYDFDYDYDYYDYDGEGTDAARLAATCLSGTKLLNREILRAPVAPGKHLLYVYEPQPQISLLGECSAFSFSFRTFTETADESEFNCEAAPLPWSLNDPGFLSASGHFHTVDDFAVPQVSEVAVRVSEPSILRIAADEADLVSFELVSRVGPARTPHPMLQDGVAAVFGTLEANKDYLLIVTPSAAVTSDASFCTQVRLEIAVAPASDEAVSSCPSHGTDVLPQLSPSKLANLGASGGVLEYPGTDEDGVPVDFVTYSDNTVIGSYTFTVADAVLSLRTELASDFLRSNLRLTLHRVADDGSSSLVAIGVNKYNLNSLRVILSDGRYSLRIEQAMRISLGGAADVWTWPDCTRFNFAMFTEPLSTEDLLDECLDRTAMAELLPPSLDSIRFLRTEAQLDFRSASYLVPQSETNSFFVERRLNFTVPNDSIMRVFVGRHEVDIDVALLKGRQVVASGSNGIDGHETFLARVSSGEVYSLRLQFWFWSAPTDACPVFDMAVAIDAAEPLSPVLCPNGGDSLPTLPTASLQLPFAYDSRAPSGTMGAVPSHSLYLQQREGEAREELIPFSLGTTASVHVEVRSESAHAQLLVEIIETGTDAVVRYGSADMGRTFATATALAAGSYAIRVYETTPALPGLAGCAAFSFKVVAEAPGAAVALASTYLPHTLDSPAYLMGSHSMYLLETFDVALGSGQRPGFSLTLEEPSLVRAARDPELSRVSLRLTQDTATGTTIADGSTSLVARLDAGTYYVSFDDEGGVAPSRAAPSALDVAFAVEPVAQIQSDNALHHSLRCHTCESDPDACLHSIAVDSDGFYRTTRELHVSFAANTTVLGSQTFDVHQSSVLYVRLGFQFLLYALEVQVLDADTKVPVVSGFLGYNSFEINAGIAAGSYEVRIVLPEAGDAVHDLLPSCARVDFDLVLRDAAQSVTSLCSSLYDVPESLNAFPPHEKYGVPMDDSGVLHIHGERFLMSPEGNDLMHLHVEKETAVVLYSRGTSYTDMRHTVTRHGGTGFGLAQANIPTFSTLEDFGAALLTAYVLPSAPSDWNLDVSYGYYFDQCAFLELSVIAKPLAAYRSSLTCAADTAAPSVPATLGDGGTVRLDGVMSLEAASSRYSTTVSVSKPTVLSAAVEFDALAMVLVLDVHMASGQVHHSRFAGLDAGGASSTMSSVLSVVLEEEGDHELVLSVEKYNGSYAVLGDAVRPSGGESLCAPFSYEVSVEADDATSVLRVVPAGASNVHIGGEERLRITVTFPTAVTSASRAPVTPAEMAAAFALEDNAFSHTSVPAEIAEMDGDARHWTLTFDTSAFSEGDRAVLTLMPARLFDPAGGEITLKVETLYVFVTDNCGEHGTFNKDDKVAVCECDKGYAGSYCGQCDRGFDRHPTSNACVVVTGGSCGSPGRCGCAPGTSGESCEPMGTCSLTTIEGSDTLSSTCKCKSPLHDAASGCTECVGDAGGWPECKGTKDKSSTDKSGGGGGAAVGIIVALVVVGALVGGGYLYIRRRKSSSYLRMGEGKSFAMDSFNDDESASFNDVEDGL